MKYRHILPAVMLAALALTCHHTANATTPADWEPVGTAEYTDGWIMPYFDITDNSRRTWHVDIERSATAQIFRIVDPYHAPEFLAAFETAPNTASPCHIIIDCTDMDFVRMEYQPVFTFAPGIFSNGAEQQIHAHTRADYYEALGRTSQAITAAGLNNTFSGNCIILRECLVGFTSDPYAGTHTWNAGAYPTIVKLPSSAIYSIAAPQADTAPRIYNLQGMRMQAPVAGQPFIELMPDGTTRKRF